jgi:restriction system protein
MGSRFLGEFMTTDYNDWMVPLHLASHDGSYKADGEAELPLAPCAVSPALSEISTAYKHMVKLLSQQLLGYIYAQDHSFFERLVVDVVFSLGYGGRRRDLARTIGRSHDGGVDGIISLDALGLDVIYLQAKRLKLGAMVPVSAIRDFAGSLDAKHAAKGIFVTTGNFSPAAHDVVKNVSKKIILINGQKLAELMTRYNIGVKTTETFQFKEINLRYFTDLAM